MVGLPIWFYRGRQCFMVVLLLFKYGLVGVNMVYGGFTFM